MTETIEINGTPYTLDALQVMVNTMLTDAIGCTVLWCGKTMGGWFTLVYRDGSGKPVVLGSFSDRDQFQREMPGVFGDFKRLYAAAQTFRELESHWSDCAEQRRYEESQREIQNQSAN